MMADRVYKRSGEGWWFSFRGDEYGPYHDRREAVEDLEGLRSSDARWGDALASKELSPRQERALLKREGLC
jgi:hypothetical protein